MTDPTPRSTAQPRGGRTPGGDATSRSLSDALSISFALLKVLMVVLLVVFIASGSHYVETNQVAVQLRFGRVVGEPGQQVLSEGLHFAWPAPIDRIVTVPTSPQWVAVDDAFWVEPDEETDLERRAESAQIRNGLDPRKTGFLITADGALVHGRWRVEYDVKREDSGVVGFVTNVGSMEKARTLVRQAAEGAIVKTVAATTVDDFRAGRTGGDGEDIRRLAQQRLDALNTGLRVTEISRVAEMVPLPLRETFRNEAKAASTRDQRIAAAASRRRSILLQTAGQNYGEILETINAYEAARREQRDDLPEIEQRLAALFDPVKVSGEVAQLLSEAEAYRRSVEQRVRGDVERFESLLQAWQRDPRIVLSREWQKVRQAVLGGDVETFYLPPDDSKHLQIELNRDPEVQRKREAERLKKAQEE